MGKHNLAVSVSEPGDVRELTQEKVLSRIHIDSRFSSPIIFFTALLTLLFYLLAFRFKIDLPVITFFISSAVIALSLLYQIFFIDLSHGYSGLIILEITLASLVFHYIYQIPAYGFYGTDSYYDLASMRAILESGHLAGVRDYVNITSFFPVIHVMGAELSLVTGIDNFNVAKWFPSILGSVTIPMVFLLVRQLFKQEKAALLAALLFATIQHYIMFGSLFVRETVGIAMALSCVYFYVSAKSSGHPLAFRILAIIFLGGTIIAHHLTSVMLLLALTVYWLFSFFADLLRFNKTQNDNGEESKMSFSFLLIGIVGTLLFWITTVSDPVRIGMSFLNDLFSPGTWGTRTILDPQTSGIVSLPNIRYYLLVYGSYASYLLFGLMLIYKIFSRRGPYYIETPAFTVYLIICGIFGFMSFFLLPATIGGDRFLAFGWLFAFGPLALAITGFKNALIKGASALLVVLFIFINIFTIHPTMWDPHASGTGGSADKEDFALAQNISFPTADIIGHPINIIIIFKEQQKMGTDAYFLLDPTDILDFKWVIINREGLGDEGLYSNYTRDMIAEMTQMESANSFNHNRIYESNNLVIFEKR